MGSYPFIQFFDQLHLLFSCQVGRLRTQKLKQILQAVFVMLLGLQHQHAHVTFKIINEYASSVDMHKVIKNHNIESTLMNVNNIMHVIHKNCTVKHAHFLFKAKNPSLT